MSRHSPFVIVLSEGDRAELVRRAGSYSEPYAVVVRAKIVLLAADGLENVEIAARVGVCVDVVSKWRKRFCQNRIGGLADRKRVGRRRVFAASAVAEIKAMACEPPTCRGAPLSRWSSKELADQAVAESVVASVSASSVRRWPPDSRPHSRARFRRAFAHQHLCPRPMKTICPGRSPPAAVLHRRVYTKHRRPQGQSDR